MCVSQIVHLARWEACSASKCRFGRARFYMVNGQILISALCQESVTSATKDALSDTQQRFVILLRM